MINTKECADVRLLTINPGSSSLKAGLYRIGGGERREIAMRAERIGASGGHLTNHGRSRRGAA